MSPGPLAEQSVFFKHCILQPRRERASSGSWWKSAFTVVWKSRQQEPEAAGYTTVPFLMPSPESASGNAPSAVCGLPHLSWVQALPEALSQETPDPVKLTIIDLPTPGLCFTCPKGYLVVDQCLLEQEGTKGRDKEERRSLCCGPFQLTLAWLPG